MLFLARNLQEVVGIMDEDEKTRSEREKEKEYCNQ
jgi:hypothetical protein